MTRIKAKSREGRPPVTRATEPSSYDIRFYARVLLASFIIILLVAGFIVYSLFFKTVTLSTAVVFDLSTLIPCRSSSIPDTANPCIVIQEHLEATRMGKYQEAYDYLSEGLKQETPFEKFVSSADESLLLEDVSGYVFPEFKVDGTAATVDGYIQYRRGGRSKVEVAFAREGDSWKIALMTIVFE